MKKPLTYGVLLALLLIVSDHSGAPAYAAPSAAVDICAPRDIQRADFFVPVTSTLPGYPGLAAEIDVHAVIPIYEETAPEGCAMPTRRAAILVHGAMTDGVTTFDLRFGEYSAMSALAKAGIDAFAVNLLGYGLSTRFGLDDPCNASTANQERFLSPNPLETGTCALPEPYHYTGFTNTSVAGDQLDAVVNAVRELSDVDAVHLFGWSRGGVVIGPYAATHPEKVSTMALLASGYRDMPLNLPSPRTSPVPPLLVRDRDAMFSEWTRQLDTANCPGQRNPGIDEAIWNSVQARDPIGTSWGSLHPRTGGIQRAPSWDLFGWRRERASTVTVPALVFTGLLDLTNVPGKEIELYNDLGSENKVLIKIACASHQALWEGSNAGGWKGPHASIHEALVEWMTSSTYRGVARGSFLIGADGSISSE